MKEKKAKSLKTASGKPTFNVIDVLIIVVVIACVAGVALRYTVLNENWNQKNDEVYYITFRAEVKGKFETTRTITVKYKAAPTSDTSSNEPNNTTERPSSESDTSSAKPNEGGSCASCSSFAALPLLALSAVALLGTALVTKKK